MKRYIVQPLVRDRSLMLSVEEDLRSLASDWMPSIAAETVAHSPEGAAICVRRGVSPNDSPETTPSLMLGGVRAWVNGDSAHVANATRTLTGDADLANRKASLLVADAEPPTADVTYALAMTAALLLVRDGRTPVHSGGVVDPDTGRGWLLVGDTHTGKSTTTANLMKSGWAYLSDDYVVLSRAGDMIEVEGWPDDFHLDEGWHRGESTGVRRVVSEHDLPSGKRAEAAPLGGILFTRIAADKPTAIETISPAAALERLMRQSPWLVADSKCAAQVFRLLSDAASRTCGDLRLGRDVLADPKKLDSLVRNFAHAQS